MKQRDLEIKELNKQMKSINASLYCKNVVGNKHRWKNGQCQGRKCLFCNRDENFKDDCIWSLAKYKGRRKCVDCERYEIE